MACDIFHGTSRDKLASIAKLGLLPREQLEARGLEVNHDYWTKTGVVYVCDDEDGARGWCGYWGTDTTNQAIALCVDVEVYSFDRNFPDGAWESGGMGPTAYEVLGPVSPDRIRIHIDGQCIALTQYVGRQAA